jgi:hypothetical protein
MGDTYKRLKCIYNSIVKVFLIRQVEKKIQSESVALKLLGRQTDTKVSEVYKSD